MILITAIGYPFALYMNLGPVVDAFIVAMMAAYGSSILASLSALGVEIPGLDRLGQQFQPKLQEYSLRYLLRYQ